MIATTSSTSGITVQQSQQRLAAGVSDTPILFVDGGEIVILYAYDETPDAPADPVPSAADLGAISINWN